MDSSKRRRLIAGALAGVIFSSSWLVAALLHWSIRGGPEAGALVRILLGGLLHPVTVGVLLGLLGVLGSANRPWKNFLFVFTATFAASFFLYRDDLASVANRLGPRGGKEVLLLALQMLFALSVPFAAWVAVVIRRGVLLKFAGLLGLGLLIGNHLVLPGLYPGLHFLFAVAGVVFLGTLAAAHMKFAFIERAVDLKTLMVVSFALLFVSGVGGTWAVQSSSVATNLLAAKSVTLPAVRRIQFLVSAPDLGGGADDLLETLVLQAPDPPPARQLSSPSVVVFLTVDAFRADLLHLPEFRTRFPGLLALRDEAIDFRNARAPAPATYVSLASIFLGKPFSALHWTEADEGSVFGYGRVVEDKTARLGPTLAKAGVRVVCIAGTPFIRAAMRDLIAPPELPIFLKNQPGVVHAPAKAILREVRNAVRQAVSEASPTFIYAHLMEPHAPYDLGLGRGAAFDRYLSEVELVDQAFRELRESLGESEARVTWIVSADHGEAFGEHGLNYHASHLFDEFVRVPLLVRLPGVRSRLEMAPVSVMDAGATLYHLFGLAVPRGHSGLSLLPAVRRGGVSAKRTIIVEAGTRKRALIFEGRLKLVESQSTGIWELYDLSSDPTERLNLFDEHPGAPQMASTLRRFFAQNAFSEPGYVQPYIRP